MTLPAATIINTPKWISSAFCSPQPCLLAYNKLVNLVYSFNFLLMYLLLFFFNLKNGLQQYICSIGPVGSGRKLFRRMADAKPAGNKNHTCWCNLCYLLCIMPGATLHDLICKAQRLCSSRNFCLYFFQLMPVV